VAKARKPAAKKTTAVGKTGPAGKKAPPAKANQNVPANATGSEKSVEVDRRSTKDRRSGGERRKKGQPVKTERRKIERRAKVNRRRQIDPTTCERDYSNDELEFMNAMDEYKRASGRMFPTCSEVLEVIKKLGYRKCAESEPAAPPVLSLHVDSVEQPPEPAV